MIAFSVAVSELGHSLCAVRGNTLIPERLHESLCSYSGLARELFRPAARPLLQTRNHAWRQQPGRLQICCRRYEMITKQNVALQVRWSKFVGRWAAVPFTAHRPIDAVFVLPGICIAVVGQPVPTIPPPLAEGPCEVLEPVRQLVYSEGAYQCTLRFWQAAHSFPVW